MNGSVYVGNRGGMPVVTATPVVGTADVRFSLPNHLFRFAGQKGLFVIELTTPVISTTTTLPILIEVNGQTLPLVNSTGATLTASDVGSVIYYEVLFDKSKNVFALTSSLV